MPSQKRGDLQMRKLGNPLARLQNRFYISHFALSSVFGSFDHAHCVSRNQHVNRFLSFPQYLIPLFCILCFSACGGGVQLIDIPKSTATLNLSKEQREKVTSQISLIRDIAEDYKFEKNELMADYHRYRSNARMTQVSRYEGLGRNRTIYRARNALRTKFRNFITQREQFIKEITEIVEEIRGTLTPEQLAAFEKIKLPALELPDILKRRPNEEFRYVPGTRFGRWDDF
jgi:hypothetical protein